MRTVRARGGVAAATLGGILAITVGWWALALWPGGSEAPEWLLRTRLACFGAMGDALPNAGGWVLLIGEPLGMLAVLVSGWGDALARDLAALRARRWGRAVLVATALVLVAGSAGAAGRVAEARGVSPGAIARAAGEGGGAGAFEVRLDRPAPPLSLVDQRGAPFTLERLRGRPVIVTFAYAHCQTVCPTLVESIRKARGAGGERVAPLVIVTLDPWRDVPSRLPAIAEGWGLAGDDVVLSGRVEDVERLLDAWGVGRARDARTGEVGHAAPVMLLDRAGRWRYRIEGGVERVGTLLSQL